MQSTAIPVHLRTGEGATYWYGEERATIKLSAEQSGGTIGIFESVERPGTEPPPHIHHNEDEAFYVLAGRVAVTVAGQRMELEAGGFAWGPREVPHSYEVLSDEARLLVVLTPGGFEGIFSSIGTPDARVDDAPPPPPAPEVAEPAFARFGLELVA